MKALFTLLIILISTVASGQKMPSDYFEEASNYFEDEKFDAALKGYQYIVNNHKNNELYPRAFYNIGYVYFVQKKYKNAISIFKKILESNFFEKEILGVGLMADPYTNYKHRASEMLSKIYYTKQNFEKALYYLAMSDSTYPYLHYCGNENASNAVKTALRYASIYQKLNQPEKAIEKLLLTAFILYTDNSKVIEELKKLLADKKGLKQELEESLSKMYSRKIDGETYSYIKFYFKFLNVELVVPNRFEVENEKIEKEKAINEIKSSTFYKMIESLGLEEKNP